MKPHSLLFVALISGLALARAEDVAPPAAPNSSPEAGTPATLQPQDLQLAPIPQKELPSPELAAPAPNPRPAPLKKGTAEQLREAIKIRELKTVVEQDPEVLSQKAAAECAKTEEGRRVLMRNYYTLLYTKIEKLDPSLQPALEIQLHEILTRYEQHKVYPSVLIEPVVALPGSNSADHAPPAGEATPSGGKSSKKKAKEQ